MESHKTGQKNKIIEYSILFLSPILGAAAFFMLQKAPYGLFLSQIVSSIFGASAFLMFLNMDQGFYRQKIRHMSYFLGCYFLSFLWLGFHGENGPGCLWLLLVVFAALDAGIELAICADVFLMLEYAVMALQTADGQRMFVAYFAFGLVVAVLFAALRDWREAAYLFLIMVAVDIVLHIFAYDFQVEAFLTYWRPLLEELLSLAVLTLAGVFYFRVIAPDLSLKRMVVRKKIVLRLVEEEEEIKEAIPVSEDGLPSGVRIVSPRAEELVPEEKGILEAMEVPAPEKPELKEDESILEERKNVEEIKEPEPEEDEIILEDLEDVDGIEELVPEVFEPEEPEEIEEPAEYAAEKAEEPEEDETILEDLEDVDGIEELVPEAFEPEEPEEIEEPAEYAAEKAEEPEEDEIILEDLEDVDGIEELVPEVFEPEEPEEIEEPTEYAEEKAEEPEEDEIILEDLENVEEIKEPEPEEDTDEFIPEEPEEPENVEKPIPEKKSFFARRHAKPKHPEEELQERSKDRNLLGRFFGRSPSSKGKQEQEKTEALQQILQPDYELAKRLRKFSPGLYLHSQKISMLAGGAAKLAGGSELLARAGGMYHEIGRIIPSENYIVAGETIAKEAGFPKELIAVIRQHSPMYEAPKSIEAAAVMLSDSIISTGEYLSKKGQRDQISDEHLIESIFQKRISKGNLQEVSLSEDELKKLKEYFIRYVSVIEKQEW